MTGVPGAAEGDGGREVIARGMRSEIIAWGPGKVLKLYAPGWPAGAAAAEAADTRRLHELGLSVPAVFEQVEVEGRQGIVFERVDGPTMEARIKARPWLGGRLIRRMAETQAAINRVRMPAARPIKDQLANKLRRASALPDGARGAALAALAAMPDGDNLCHGDYHGGNVILAPGRGPVVIDWDSPSRGRPAADVARAYLVINQSPLHVPAAARPLLGALVGGWKRAYLAAYWRAAAVAPPEGAEFAAWLWLHAAARLAEGIAVEERALLAMVRRGLAGQGTAGS